MIVIFPDRLHQPFSTYLSEIRASRPFLDDPSQQRICPACLSGVQTFLRIPLHNPSVKRASLAALCTPIQQHSIHYRHKNVSVIVISKPLS